VTIINNSIATHGNLTYSGFQPYTNYSAEVVAVNDDNKTSTKKTFILSAEKSEFVSIAIKYWKFHTFMCYII